MTLAYHFTGATLRDGRPLPARGEWLMHDGPLIPCESGLHASADPFDALPYAPGTWLHRVELGGVILPHGDPPTKLCATQRRIVVTIQADGLLHIFARWCALQVIDLWKAPDIVRAYLDTGDLSLRQAAEIAASIAVRAASRTAARTRPWRGDRGGAWNGALAATWSVREGLSGHVAAVSAVGEAIMAVAEAAAAEAVTSGIKNDPWRIAAEAARDAKNAQRAAFHALVHAAFAACAEEGSRDALS